MPWWSQVISQLPGDAPSRTLPGLSTEPESGIEEIHQIAVPINDSIDLPGLSGFGFSGPVGAGSAVLCLVVPVVAELIAVLDDELGSRHGW